MIKVTFNRFWIPYFLKYYIQCKIFGNRIPILAGFKITNKCNLQCRHCPFWQNQAQDILTYEKVISILRTLKKRGVRIIIFEGGEPFLWRDGSYTMYDVVAEAKKYFFSVGMITNGTFALDIQTDVLWVSIDGLKETHNRTRGVSFEQIINNIESASHPNLLANITINKSNCREIADCVSYIAKMVKGITIQFYYPYDGDMALFVPVEERGDVLRQLIQLKRAGYPILDSYQCLEALGQSHWKCEDWMLANVDADGQIIFGCYVKNRGDINCKICGFAAHTEISFAFQRKIRPIFVGQKIFHYRDLPV